MLIMVVINISLTKRVFKGNKIIYLKKDIYSYRKTKKEV